MALQSIELLAEMAQAEDENIKKYSEQHESLFNSGGRVNWQKVSEVKDLISYHEGRKSILDEMLLEK